MVIKNNVLWHSLCGCRRRYLNSLIKTKFNSWDNMSHFVLASIGLNIAKFKLILWLGHCNRIVHVIRGVTGNCRLCEESRTMNKEAKHEFIFSIPLLLLLLFSVSILAELSCTQLVFIRYSISYSASYIRCAQAHVFLDFIRNVL